jgi:hypothetical protein
MLSNYTIVMFAIRQEYIEMLKEIYSQADISIEILTKNWEKQQIVAYNRAKDCAISYIELNRIEDIAPLTPFLQVIEKEIPQSIIYGSFYTAEIVKKQLMYLKNLEIKWGGETGMIERIWKKDRSLDKEGINIFYNSYKKILELAERNNGAFAISFLG